MFCHLILLVFGYFSVLKGLNIECNNLNSCSNVVISCNNCDNTVDILCSDTNECLNVYVNISNINKLTIISLVNSGFTNSTININNIKNVSIIGKDWYSFINNEISINNVNNLKILDYDSNEHESTSFRYTFINSEFRLSNINNTLFNCSISGYCSHYVDLLLDKVDFYEGVCESENSCQNNEILAESSNVRIKCGDLGSCTNSIFSCLGSNCDYNCSGINLCYNSQSPTMNPSNNPTLHPTISPTQNPSNSPTQFPSSDPTIFTNIPSKNPTITPTNEPTVTPSNYPTVSPSFQPSTNPSKQPSFNPSATPTLLPTRTPVCFDKKPHTCQTFANISIDTLCHNKTMYKDCYYTCNYCDSYGGFAIYSDTTTVNISRNDGSVYGGDPIKVTASCFTYTHLQQLQLNFGGIITDCEADINNYYTYICMSQPRRSNSLYVSMQIIFGGKYFRYSFSFVYNNIYSHGSNSGYAVSMENAFNIVEPNSKKKLRWNPGLFPFVSILNLYRSVYSSESNELDIDYLGNILNSGIHEVTIPNVQPLSNYKYLYNIKYWLEPSTESRRLQNAAYITQNDLQCTLTSKNTKQECECRNISEPNICVAMFGKHNAKQPGIAYNQILPKVWELAGLNYDIRSLEAFYYCSLGCYSHAEDHFNKYEQEILHSQIYCDLESNYECNENLIRVANAFKGKELSEVVSEPEKCLDYCEAALQCSPNPCLWFNTSLVIGTSATCSPAPTPTPPPACASKSTSDIPYPEPTPCPTTLCPTVGDASTHCMCIDTSGTVGTHDCLCNNNPDAVIIAFGDPHFESVDGIKFDFQGVGVFTGILIQDINFEMQMLNVDAGHTSVCKGVAFRSSDFPDISVYRNQLWINGSVVWDWIIKIPDYVRISKCGSTFHFKFSFGLEVFFKLYELKPTLDRSLKGRLTGLFGFYDENSTNDFTSRNGTVIYVDNPRNDEHIIYRDFGQTWIVTDEEDIIFPNVIVNRRRLSAAELELLNHRRLVVIDLNGYTPMFAVNASHLVSQLSADIVLLCANVSECIFDYIMTNNISFVAETMNSIESYKQTLVSINESKWQPICFPSCANNGTCISYNKSDPKVGTCQCEYSFYGEYCQYFNTSTVDISVCSSNSHCTIHFGINYRCNLQNNTCYESTVTTECILDSDCTVLYNSKSTCDINTNQCQNKVINYTYPITAFPTINPTKKGPSNKSRKEINIVTTLVIICSILCFMLLVFIGVYYRCKYKTNDEKIADGISRKVKQQVEFATTEDPTKVVSDESTIVLTEGIVTTNGIVTSPGEESIEYDPQLGSTERRPTDYF